ncbi:peroxiredoxin-like family protein [Paraburkholderia sp. Ac-20347]|uniref:peroxiredoxin-like family protein n=1 Tax=Paraburkholderia sp. Ac-20347 TaxID=2703892 RepID=UPI00197D4DEA|nr:peroxiredoxin-like family protein [Paraburkholderia sp. Ac-20347]MBN3811321.1 AhpC/TSA family protein [Paraburkholderia sp. Ac-20347]
MSLASQLHAFKSSMTSQVPPDALAAIEKAAQELAKSDVADNALKVGADAPSFELRDAYGNVVRLDDLLKDGPVVLTFYRGQWCPFCNLTLAALQLEFAEISRAGATLVAVSPQTQSATLQTIQTLQTSFPVLSDEGNKVAREFGLSFSLPDAVRPVYHALGADLPTSNGDDSYTLPLAATYIIGRNKKIKYAFVEADYTQRMEPADITRALKAV